MSHDQGAQDDGSWLAALRTALSWPIARRSLLVMVAVGSLLNLINQGDALFSGAAVNWYKIALTYIVPFCVATYGACCAIKALDQR